MLFSSVSFLLYFLPAFLAVFYICPAAYRKYAILAASLVFYAAGILEEPADALFLAVPLVFDYFAAKKIRACKDHGKAWFVSAVVLSAGLLVYCKYAGFFCDALYDLTIGLGLGDGSRIPALYPLLPLAISFYTFQLISYLADVYTQKCEPLQSFADYACLILYFPKLISGPVTRTADLAQSFEKPSPSKAQIKDGIYYFVFGLCFKVFLANQLGNLWSDINTIGYDSVSVALAWMGLIGYSLQLYFDFWGYSLMAMGLAKLMGLELPKNFDSPYMSLSMTEFWRRWHITLGSWFRDYVYIPLGGSRCSRGRMFLNLLCVWLLTGLWHGASYNFLLWGLVLFVLISIEKLGLKEKLDANPAAGHIYMLFAIPLTWMIFAVERLSNLWVYMQRLVGLGAVNVFAGDWIKYGKTYWWIILIGLLACTQLPAKLYKKYSDRKLFILAAAAAAGLSAFCLYKGLNDPFMYFRF